MGRVLGQQHDPKPTGEHENRPVSNVKRHKWERGGGGINPKRGRIGIRGLASRLALTGFGLLVALLLAEMLLRIFRLAPSQSIATVNASDFERSPGLFTPGQDIIDLQNPALPHRTRINSLGYRGTDFAQAARPGELRILMIGDSFTFGDFVDDEETLTARLEALLRVRCGDVTVINAGVGGTTIITHIEMARRALPLHLGLVILTFSENDVSDLATPMWYGLAENRRMKSRFPFSVLYPVLRETALWNFALRVKATLAIHFQRDDFPQGEGHEEPEPSGQAKLRQRAEYSEHVAELHALLEKRGLPLAFAAYPSHHSVTQSDVPDQMAWVVATARALGLPTVSYLSTLRGSGHSVDELYLLPHDGHPSPLGYEIAAAELLSNLDWSTLTAGRCIP
jgi:lysophospholipase L1-like esterase